mmetsp:Transcript_30825/g.45594  ORF Transcript_30825/g.45594 Transcript_30825/m.45594 type:complete len:242 (-) Transcript_30825:863-1588(-)
MKDAKARSTFVKIIQQIKQHFFHLLRLVRFQHARILRQRITLLQQPLLFSLRVERKFSEFECFCEELTANALFLAVESRLAPFSIIWLQKLDSRSFSRFSFSLSPTLSFDTKALPLFCPCSILHSWLSLVSSTSSIPASTVATLQSLKELSLSNKAESVALVIISFKSREAPAAALTLPTAPLNAGVSRIKLLLGSISVTHSDFDASESVTSLERILVVSSARPSEAEFFASAVTKSAAEF